MLREMARRLALCVRSVDRVARVGGEEFGLILVQSDAAAALPIAQRVCAAMRSEPVRVSEGITLPITVSAGVAALPQHARSAMELIAAADRALYAAKAAGRDRAVAAGPA